MSEDWPAAAREIFSAIAQVGFFVTLEKPGTRSGVEWAPTIGAPTSHQIMAIDMGIVVSDDEGTKIGNRQRVLTVAASSVVPDKADRIQVRGVWHDIAEVMPLAPGGVDLLFKVKLVS